MGNSTSRVVGCFMPSGNGVNLEFFEPLDEGLGHSFCYVRPVIADSPAITPSNSERYTLDSSTLDSETCSGSFRQEVVEDSSALQRPYKSLSETTFKTISGASVSANASTIRTGNLDVLLSGDALEPAASFESTASFAAIPLQPVPRGSGPLNGFMSGPLERGFMSGPLERGFMSGPIDKGMYMSGPIDGTDRSNFSASLAYGRRRAGLGRLMRGMSRPMRSALSRTFTRRLHGSGWIQRLLLHPMTKMAWHPEEKFRSEGSRNCGEVGPSETEYSSTRNLQWAHGKAGEDRVHVVLSEEQGWLFVGIYDGFSGPDAPDFLMTNLYKAIDNELEGLLWDYDDKAGKSETASGHLGSNAMDSTQSENVVSQSHDHEKGALPVWSNEDESGGRPTKGVESVKSDEIVAEKGGFNDIDRLHVADEINKDQETIAGDENIEAVHIDSPKIEAYHISAKRCRKSKRLYELLQMELVQECDMKSSQMASVSNKNSLDLLQNSEEELYTRETLPTTGHVLCSKILGGGSSVCMEEASSFRESDGVLEKSSGNGSVASNSPSGHTHMLKRSLVALKLRKMYSKQKSLRKKLFPWSYDWHRDKSHVDEGILNPSVTIRRCKSGPVDHDEVLKAMSRALEITEEAYMEMVEKALDKNPELALMGSCVLVMLMKDQDVYVMNLGDSRVILAQDRLNDHHGNQNLAKDDARYRNRSRELMVRVELDRISEESPIHNPKSQLYSTNKNREISLCGLRMRALQLSTDHSTSIEEEVIRIRAEHADDSQAVMNDRVKGQLKVTRAFGAGFLKRAEFNEALLEMFRIDYIGSSPYISCIPWSLHHRLCSSDRFLVLSSDGLYQYFSNEEVVSHVSWFMENVPEGDPAQHLISELLFRAAKKNGMEFHDLLDIPQGDRRKYHDDVSVMVVSLEGRFWRSSG